MIFWTSISAAYAQKEEQRPSPLPSSCISLDSESKRILITCDATFTDVKKEITDKSLLKSEGTGVGGGSDSGNSGNYILDATIIVNNSATTFSMSSSELKWLKIVGPNSIAVYGGKINFDGVKITSWDPGSNSGKQHRANDAHRTRTRRGDRVRARRAVLRRRRRRARVGADRYAHRARRQGPVVAAPTSGPVDPARGAKLVRR